MKAAHEQLSGLQGLELATGIVYRYYPAAIWRFGLARAVIQRVV